MAGLPSRIFFVCKIGGRWGKLPFNLFMEWTFRIFAGHECEGKENLTDGMKEIKDYKY
jgi:hypothetical protein